MDVMPCTVLLNPDYRLPPVAPALTGMGWVRSHVARFSEGRTHEERRRLVERVVAAAGFPRVSGSATASLLAALGLLRAGSGAVPVPTTRRIAPDGREVLVDLADAPFGLGAHACPGRDLALHLAREAQS